MKKIVVFIFVLTFVACSQESGKEEIREQMAQYKKEMNELPEENYVTLSYKQMCTNPASVIEKIRRKCKMHDNYDIPIENEPPKNFSYRTYDNSKEEKRIFKERFKEIRQS